jgi:hypothetical protein
LGDHGVELRLRGDGEVADLAAVRLRDLADRVGEGEQPGAGDLVELAGVARLGDGGEVVRGR